MEADRTRRLGVPSLVALLLVLLWVAGAFWSFSERQRVVSAREKALANLALGVEYQTLQLLRLAEVSIQAAALWINEHPKALPALDPSFIKLVVELRRVSDGMLDLRLVDSAGGLHVVPAASPQPVANLADSDDIGRQLNPLTRGLYIGNPTLSAVDQKWIVPVTYPVVKPGGELVVIAAILDFDHIARLFELQRDKPNGSITILKTDGVSLIRSPAIEGAIGKSIAKAPDFIEHLSVIERGQYRVKGAFDGVDRLISHASLKHYPLIIAVTSSIDDALAPWRRELWETITLILFFTVTTLLLTRRFMRLDQEYRARLTYSDQRSRDFSLTASDWFWETDAEHRFIYFSDNFDQVYQGNMAHFLGKSRRDLLEKDQLNPPEMIAEHLAQLDAHVPFRNLEYRTRGSDGSIRWTSVSGLPHIDADGRFLGYRGTASLITERKLAEEALHESEKHIRLLFNSGNDPIFVYEADSLSGAPVGHLLEVNDMACFRLGWSREELLRMRPEDILAPEAAKHPAPNVKLAFNREAVYESVLLTRDGKIIPVEFNAHLFERYDKAMVFAMARDITQRKESERSLRLAASVFASTQEGIMITDADNRIVDVNKSFTRITGYSRESVLKLNPRLLKSSHQSQEFYSDMWRTVTAEGHWQGELWNRRQDGQLYAQRLTISVVKDEQGQVMNHLGVISDVTVEKRQKELLEKTAHFDALTGIPNRVLLTDRMHQALAQTLRSRTLLAVCYLDLDGFKPVNDTYGHETGDHVLVEVAARLRSCLRGGDTAARLGGDEFVLLLLGLDNVHECETTLSRLLDALKQPLIVCGHSVSISASIGVSLFPMDDADSETLLRHADQAMYQSKLRGKGCYQIFELSSAHTTGRATESAMNSGGVRPDVLDA